MAASRYLELVDKATSVDQLIKLVLAFGAELAINEASMGVKKISGVSLNKQRKAANNAAKAVLLKVDGDPSLLTEQDKDTLRAYSGIGGTDTETTTNGHLHEYYTPVEIAAGMWSAMAGMGFAGGNTLEPSAGSGVFQEVKPVNTVMTAAEIDATSSQINQLLHPGDKVHNQPFEVLAENTPDGIYDSVVGNVPFGDRGACIAKDKSATSKKYKKHEQYFVSRVIDKVKAGGLISLVVPTSIVSGAANKKLRQDISFKAEFLGAHRLPAGVFSNSNTDVTTDIIFLRKHSDELKDAIDVASQKTLVDANVLWNDFISGRYFETAGKQFVHGTPEMIMRGDREVLTVKNTGELTNKQLAGRLMTKFESRIDWAAFEAAEPIQQVWAAGDSKVMNGYLYEFDGISWNKLDTPSSGLDPITYGAESVDELSAIFSNRNAVLGLSFEQVQAVASNYPYLVDDGVRNALSLGAEQPEKYQEQVYRGALIGMTIEALQNPINGYKAEDIETAKELVLAEIDRYGIPPKGKMKALSGKSGRYWNAFNASVNGKGELSDLLTGQLDRSNSSMYDLTNPEHVIAYLDSLGESQVEIEQVNAILKDGEMDMPSLAALDGVAVTPAGGITPLRYATSGNVVDYSRELKAAIAGETNPALISNYEKQLAEIAGRRKLAKVDDISFNMSARWIPRKYITEFLSEVGLLSDSPSSQAVTYCKRFETDTSYSGDKVITPINPNYDGEDGMFVGQSHFASQLGNWLNGGSIGTSQKKEYMATLATYEEQFSSWICQHPEIDQLVDVYNDKFNAFLPAEYSGAPLKLENVSGKVQNFDYQNAEIRRLSEMGGGICGFGTGLGKSFTACGLIAYDHQQGRSTKTALVVPKSVLENWWYETHSFFDEKFLANTFFPGMDFKLDKSGTRQQENVLDDTGKPRLGKDGQPLKRDKVKFLTGKELDSRLALIAQNNYKLVVMTIEQFDRIDMRPDTVGEYTARMVSRNLLDNSKDNQALISSYRESQKKARLEATYSDAGNKKNNDIPYFEDMGFDKIITDEGHLFRNSYAARGEATRIAFLPTQGSAKRSVGLAMKADHIKRQRGGTGVTLLSATPTVNSPTDIFNMLSLVMPDGAWTEQFGITDVNDFIRTFGATEQKIIPTISGALVEKTALTGFNNLSGLRGIFHKYVNLKSAQDVSSTVEIPDLLESKAEVPMSAEQQDVYVELRQRADDLNNKEERLDDDGNLIEKVEGDSVFAIIRDMDRVTTDMDLYNRTITYRLSAPEKSVNELVDDLPATVSIKSGGDGDDGDDSTGKVSADAQVWVDGDITVLQVSQYFEDEVEKRFSKFGIDESAISHPIPPKYAQMIANMKTGLLDGKQIVFSEEKTQHRKLQRIIARSLGLDKSQIGIINADTVGKKESGIEDIAANYNTGKYLEIICNKKAEVGVNLHMGTTDIHHLTLPWTPASIKQRNGRGARVGSKQSSVRVYYYVGKGSFDTYRLETLKKKSEWIDTLWSSDEQQMANADALDGNDVSIMLAKDPEDARRRKAEAEARIEAEKAEKIRKKANIDIASYLKARRSMRSTMEEMQGELAAAQAQLSELKSQSGSIAGRKRMQCKNKIKRLTQDIASRPIAEKQIKRLEPLVSKVVKDKVLNVQQDIFTNPEAYYPALTRIFKVGQIYKKKTYGSNYQLVKILPHGYYSSINGGDSYPIGTGDGFGKEADFNQAENDFLVSCNATVRYQDLVGLDREMIIKLVSAGHLSMDGYGLVVDADKFAAEYMGKRTVQSLVMPEPNNNELVARVGKFIISNKDREYVNQCIISAFWSDGMTIDKLVATYGNIATDAEMQKMAADTIVATKKRDDVQALLTDAMDTGVLNHEIQKQLDNATVDAVKQFEFDNGSQFKSIMRDAVVNELDAIKKAINEAQATKVAEIISEIKSRMNTPIAQRSKRIQSLIEEIKAGSSNIQLIDIADLVLVTTASASANSSLDSIATLGALRDLLSDLIADVRRDPAAAMRLLIDVSGMNPDAETQLWLDKRKAEADNAAAIAAFRVNADSILITKNRSLIRVAKLEFQPGEAFCLLDSDGYGGELRHASPKLKAKFGAKWNKPAGQWVISTEHNLDDILDVIGVTVNE